MNIETAIKSWNKKTISKIELEKLLCTDSDHELHELVCEAVAAGLLSPVKNSGTNGNRIYPLYLKYRILIKEDYLDALSDIAKLHPALTKNGYLQSRPDLYQKYETQIQKLDTYMFKKHKSVTVSRKERSFEIFDEEKLLDDAAFRGILEHIGLTRETLGYYETPEYCFNDFIPRRKDRMVLLVCENKDIWFNIRRRMYEDGANTIFDTQIDGVVYGCGNRVSEIGALTEYTRFMGNEDVRYLYWGDIDRAGIDIYLSLIKNNPALHIQLFVPAYIKMLELAEYREIPDSEDCREKTRDNADVFQLFSAENRERLSRYIDNNKRLPQEIISYEILLKEMR